MKRSIQFLLTALTLLWLTACSMMPQRRISVAAEDSFNVRFEGIILHARFCDPVLSTPSHCVAKRRAIIPDPRITSMPHVAELEVPTDVDRASLRDATGQLVECDANNCRVRILGFDMRIVDADGAEVTGGLTVDPSFDTYVPQLARDEYIRAGGLNAALTRPGAPTTLSAGYFEIGEGGVLAACPFRRTGNLPNGGKFVTTVAGTVTNSGPCRLFARSVSWKGGPIRAPRLEIRSSFTSGEWRPIAFLTPHPLLLTIHNHPRGNVTPTPDHFVLYEKLLVDTKLPTIELCDTTDGPACSAGGLVAVPGCADTSWP